MATNSTETIQCVTTANAHSTSSASTNATVETDKIDADAAKSKMARKIVLRRQTGMGFTGPLGLVACAKCFLAVFLSIFSV